MIKYRPKYTEIKVQDMGGGYNDLYLPNNTRLIDVTDTTLNALFEKVNADVDQLAESTDLNPV